MKGKWSILAVIAGIVGVICERMSTKEAEAERMEEINNLKERVCELEVFCENDVVVNEKKGETNGEAGVFGREE